MKHAVVDKEGNIQYFFDFFGNKEDWVSPNEEFELIQCNNYINFDYKWFGSYFKKINTENNYSEEYVYVKEI